MKHNYSILFFFLQLTCIASLFGQSTSGDYPVQTKIDLYTIRAKLVDKTTGATLSGRNAYVSIPGPVFEFRATVSDSSGNVVFLVKNLASARPLIFQTNNITDSNCTFEFNNPLVEKFPAEKYPDKVNAKGDTLPFYGKSDKVYLLDDYTRFPTMEEVLREYVFEVRVRRQRDRYRIEVLNVPYNLFFENEPLVLLDGVPVFDTNALLSVDPLKIREIRILARKYYFGTMIFSGIVSISSYAGDLAGYPLPPQAQVKAVNQDIFVK